MIFIIDTHVKFGVNTNSTFTSRIYLDQGFVLYNIHYLQLLLLLV